MPRDSWGLEGLRGEWSPHPYAVATPSGAASGSEQEPVGASRQGRPCSWGSLLRALI